MTIEAYNTISKIWSPKNAAKNLLKLTENLLNDKNNDISEGPCSKAYPTKE